MCFHSNIPTFFLFFLVSSLFALDKLGTAQIAIQSKHNKAPLAVSQRLYWQKLLVTYSMEVSSEESVHSIHEPLLTGAAAAEEEEEGSSIPHRRDSQDVHNTTDNNIAGEEDEESPLQSCCSFLKMFFCAKGTIPILIMSTLVAFGMGSVIGIVPDVVADRYARIRYHYSGPDCTSYTRFDKPDACQNGADDAQASAAAATLALNVLTLIFNPIVGSYSDRHGRRGVILISLVLFSLGSMVFLGLQLTPWLSPVFYYFAMSLSGAVDFTSMTFAAISDVLPKDLRAAGYGVILSGYYTGFTFAPSLPLVLSHFHVSVFSCVTAVLALLMGLVALPETLPAEIAEANQLEYQGQLDNQNQHLGRSNSGDSYSDHGSTPLFLHNPENDTMDDSDDRHWVARIAHTATRPLRDMSILTRGNLPILAAGSFFSAMVYSSDKTFVVYYIEDQLNVRDGDLAKMFLIFGSVGVVVQAFLLQPLLRIVGEKQLLVIAFISGTCHNALYGLAKSKNVILAALILSQLTKVGFPLLSSFASKSASVHEQGRVQGALFALNALANAVGPMLLEIVYDLTKNSHTYLGPGTMFLCASFLYAVGTVLVSFVPVDASSSTVSEVVSGGEDEEICPGRGHEANNSMVESLLS